MSYYIELFEKQTGIKIPDVLVFHGDQSENEKLISALAQFIDFIDQQQANPNLPLDVEILDSIEKQALKDIANQQGETVVFKSKKMKPGDVSAPNQDIVFAEVEPEQTYTLEGVFGRGWVVRFSQPINGKYFVPCGSRDNGQIFINIMESI